MKMKAKRSTFILLNSHICI